MAKKKAKRTAKKTKKKTAKRKSAKKKVSKKRTVKKKSKKKITNKKKRVTKRIKRKPAKKAKKTVKAKIKTSTFPIQKGPQLVGYISHFFDKIMVAVIELSGTLKEGDTIKIEGNTTSFEQKVASMQVNHQKVNVVHAGDSIGLKVKAIVRKGDRVYKA